MAKVLCFGELLLRICPDAAGAWLQASQLPFYVGGAEANVATALARWQVPSAYFTALPDNFLTQQLLGYLQQQHIDTSKIQLQPGRMGLYYLPKGKDMKNAGVVYDRENSSFAGLKTGRIDWDEVLNGISWFHFSAICPAISQAVADVCEEALIAASQKGIRISVDLNYREKLWQYGKEPIEVMPKLVKHCHLIMGNVWAAEKMLGIEANGHLAEKNDKQLYLQQAEETSEQMMKQYAACFAVANTFRFDEGAGIRYYATLYTANRLCVSHEYSSDKIIDKVGSGDCFMAGLIYGFYNSHQARQVVDFAASAAFAKLFIEGDATTMFAQDVTNAMHEYQH